MLVVGLGVILFLSTKKIRTIGASITLFWACIYLLPFMALFYRADLIGNFIPIAVALVLFVSFILDKLWDTRALLVGVATGFVVISMFLSAISTVFSVTPLALLNHPKEHGAVGVDRGTKAVAFWVRENTPSRSTLFTDPYAEQTESLSMYYYHRPVVSIELDVNSSMDKAMSLLSNNLSRIDGIVVGVEDLDYLPDAAKNQFHTSAEIAVNGKPSLYILTRNANNGVASRSPVILDTTVYNSRYDKLYSSLPDIIDLPFAEIQAEETKIIR